jgi:hypothetical protein
LQGSSVKTALRDRSRAETPRGASDRSWISGGLREIGGDSGEPGATLAGAAGGMVSAATRSTDVPVDGMAYAGWSPSTVAGSRHEIGAANICNGCDRVGSIRPSGAWPNSYRFSTVGACSTESSSRNGSPGPWPPSTARAGSWIPYGSSCSTCPTSPAWISAAPLLALAARYRRDATEAGRRAPRRLVAKGRSASLAAHGARAGARLPFRADHRSTWRS